MRRTAFAVALVVARLAHGADPALLRAHLAGTDPVWVGQRATVVLELLVSTTFAGAPGLDLPRIPGAVFMEIPEPPTLGTEDVEGATYTLQRRELGFWATRAGEFAVPAFAVRVASAETTGGTPVEHRLLTSPLAIAVRTPPGAAGLTGLISTPELTVREEWQPRPGERARVGDAFVRSVTRTAPDVPGMVLPPLPLAQVDGLAAYPSAPVVRDRVERGDFTGERVERITYVCERPGRALVPALRLPWWSLASRSVETVTLPGVTLRIGGAPVPGGRWWLVGLGVVLALAAAVAWRRRDVLREAWRRRRARREAGEVGCFARFERACRAGDARAAYAALLRWLEARYTNGRPATVEDDLLARHPDEELRRQAAAFEEAMLQPATTWDGRGLAAAVRRVRHAERRAGRSAPEELPALNPRSPGPAPAA